MNLIELQKKLLLRRSVSIPELQTWLNMDFVEAKMTVERLQQRGWLSNEPAGLHYIVQPKYCVLRTLQPTEADVLIEKLDSDCSSALHCLQQNTSATYGELLSAVRGEDDTDDAIAKLTELRLIYRYQDRWLLTVSKKTVSVLRSMIQHKRSSETLARRRLMEFFGSDEA